MLQPQQLAVPRPPVRLELAHFALMLIADLVLARPEEFQLLERLGRLLAPHRLADLVDLALQQHRHFCSLAPPILREIGDGALLRDRGTGFEMRTQIADVARSGPDAP